jgi:hypothetical protein
VRTVEGLAGDNNKFTPPASLRRASRSAVWVLHARLCRTGSVVSRGEPTAGGGRVARSAFFHSVRVHRLSEHLGRRGVCCEGDGRRPSHHRRSGERSVGHVDHRLSWAHFTALSLAGDRGGARLRRTPRQSPSPSPSPSPSQSPSAKVDGSGLTLFGSETTDQLNLPSCLDLPSHCCSGEGSCTRSGTQSSPTGSTPWEGAAAPGWSTPPPTASWLTSHRRLSRRRRLGELLAGPLSRTAADRTDAPVDNAAVHAARVHSSRIRPREGLK